MADEKSGYTKRRTLLKGIGSTGLVGLAGCTGGQSNGNVDQSSPTNTPTGTTAKSGGTIRVAVFPINVIGIVTHYIENSGILEEKLGEVGYDFEISYTFDNRAQFVGGNADVVESPTMISTQLAADNDFTAVVASRLETAFTGPLVKKGGPYDPENTGGVQESLNKAVENDGGIGFISWGAGNVPYEQIILSERFGLSLEQDGGDFRVVTGGPPQLIKFMMEDRIAIATGSPIHGAANQLRNDKAKPLYWLNEVFVDEGFGIPSFSCHTFRESYVDENPNVIPAYIEAYQEGYKWFYEKKNEVLGNEENWGRLGAQNEAGASYTYDWMAAPHTGQTDVNHFNPLTGYKNIHTDAESTVIENYTGTSGTEWVDLDTNTLEILGENGFIPQNWEDQIKYISTKSGDINEISF